MLSIILSVGQVAYSQPKNSFTKDLVNLNEFIVEQMEVSHIPGLSACIILRDSVVWENNFGYANLDNNTLVSDTTLFGVVSIGKSITAASFMQLWENDSVGLDQNINEVLPFPVQNPWVTQNVITPRMLMDHTSSLSDNDFESFVTIGDATMTLGYFLENYLSPGQYYNNLNFYNHAPGTQYHYSNVGPGLTGFIVENIAGVNFTDYAHDSLLLPLDMNNSGWLLADIGTNNLAVGYDYMSGNFQPNPYYGHPAYPGIMFRASAKELSNYVIMLLNGGEFKGKEILQSSTVDTITTIQNPAWGGSFGTPGLGLYCREDYGDRIVWGHNGGSVMGYAAHLYFCKDENTGIVITTNSNQYIDPVVIQMFEYAAMIIIPEEAIDINGYGFTARWNSAPSANEYYFSLYEDSSPAPIPGYDDINVGTDTSIVVTGLEPVKKYFYKIRGHNGTEFGPYSGFIETTTLPSTGLNEDETSILDFTCSPNPVINNLFIRFSVKEKQQINISLFNNLGHKILCAVESKNAMNDQLRVNISNLPSGIYFLRLQTGREMATRKIVKMR